MTADQKADVSKSKGPLVTTPCKSGGPREAEESPEKSVNLTRERPLLHRQVEVQVRKLQADLKKGLSLCDSAHDAYKGHPPELKVNDRALLALARVFQFRQETGCRCLGMAKDIKQLVPECSTQTSGGSAAGALAAQPAPSTPGASSQMTGEDDARALEQQAARQAVAFSAFLQEERTLKQKFWEGAVEDIMCLDDCWTMLEQILDASDPAKFLGLKKQWTLAQKALEQVGKGLKLGAEDLSKHLKIKVAAQKREEKRKADQIEKDQLLKVKQEAKAAAEAIKKRKVAHDVQPIFTANVTVEIAPEAFAPKTVQEVVGDLQNYKFPWVVDTPDALNLLLGDGPLQKALAVWGAQYKRTLTQAKLNQVTYPLEEKAGLADTNKAFADMIPASEVVSLAEVPGGKAFSEAAWLFGCNADLRQAGFLPNHAAMLKVLVAGEIRHLFVEWLSYKKAMADMHPGETLSNDDLLTKLKAADDDQLTRLSKRKVDMRQWKLQKGQVLFVPMGWIMVEVSGAGSLIYGFRKSWFLKSSHAEYAEAIQVVKSSSSSNGKSVERMEKILSFLKSNGQ